MLGLYLSPNTLIICFTSLRVVSHYYSHVAHPKPLQLVKAGLGAGEGDAGLGLLGGVDDLAVVDDDGVPVGPLVTGPADGLGELEVGVAHEELQAGVSNRVHVSFQQSVSALTYDGVVGDGVGLAPAGHDESVVVGEEDDVVDALGLELVLVLDEGGEVGGRAGGGEGAGDGDDDDLLVGELCGRVSLRVSSVVREVAGEVA